MGNMIYVPTVFTISPPKTFIGELFKNTNKEIYDLDKIKTEYYYVDLENTSKYIKDHINDISIMREEDISKIQDEIDRFNKEYNSIWDSICDWRRNNEYRNTRMC